MAEAEGRPAATIPVVPSNLRATQIIALLLSLAALRYGREFFVPVLVAILAAIALAPLVRQLSRIVPRWLAAAIVVLGIAGAAGFTTWILSDDIAVFSRRLPSIVRDIRTAVQSASPRQGLIRQLQQAVTELEQTAAPKPKPGDATPVTIVAPVDVQQQVMAWARRAGGLLMEVVLLMFLIYFLLASGQIFKTKLVKLSSDRLSERKVTIQMIDEITTKIGRYIFFMVWSGALVGVVTWLTFYAMGVRYAGL